MKVDLHIHTHRSRDCLMEPDAIIRKAQQRGLDALAILDHGTISGALELARIAPFLIIVGEEIKTTRGEIGGLFLRETIPSGLSPTETVKAIRAQGGIVYLPHPLDRLRRSVLSREALCEIIGQVDIVETFNARVTFPADNANARRLAEDLGLPGGGGSDAHCTYEIGRAYVVMPPYSGRDSFLEQIARGRVAGTLSLPWVHLASTWAKRYKKLIGKAS